MNDVPLIQNADINSINTSIIAIKKQLKQINEALGLIDTPDVDLSPFVKKEDVVDAVESGNLNPITSNAVANNITNTVTSGSSLPVTSGAVADYIGALYNVSGSVHPTNENQYFEICRLNLPKGKYVLIGISGTSLSINGTYNFRIIINNGVVDRIVRGNSDGGGGIINSVVINIDSPITIVAYGYGYPRYVSGTTVEQYANIQAIKVGG